MVFADIKKDKIIRCLDIIIYKSRYLISNNYKYVDEYNYQKIITIYNTINTLFKKLYTYYGYESIEIINTWYNNKDNESDILYECVENFMKKYNENRKHI